MTVKLLLIEELTDTYKILDKWSFDDYVGDVTKIGRAINREILSQKDGRK